MRVFKYLQVIKCMNCILSLLFMAYEFTRCSEKKIVFNLWVMFYVYFTISVLYKIQYNLDFSKN